jgi:hypothetical protein
MLRSKKDSVYACLRHARFCLHKTLLVVIGFLPAHISQHILD